MCHMTVRRPNLEDASQSYIIYRGSFSIMSCMEMCRDCHNQERKTFFSFSHHVHYAIIKREKRFFHLVTTFITPWSREEKVFFHLVTTLTTPWSIEENVFFHLVTTFTTPWSNHYVHYTMNKTEKSFSSFSHYVDYIMIKRGKSFFHLVTTFTTPCHDQDRKKLFFI